MPSIQLTKKELERFLASDEYKALVAKGMIAEPKKGGGKRNRGPLVVATTFTPPREDDPAGALTFTVPVRTVSEANQRAWRKRAVRTQDARSIITRLLGKHLRHLVPFAEAYHRGDTLRVQITRLGGAQLDDMANLGPALKACEDAVALVLGADDGAHNWKATAHQEPGGPAGVRVRLTVRRKTV